MVVDKNVHMVKQLLSSFFFLVISLYSYGSHIVGGEFELLHVSGTTYTLNLILYFDVVNGNPGALDPAVTARIFRKSDNVPMDTVFLPFISQNRVEYFQPDCSSGEVVTDRIVYSTTITLSAEEYNDLEGYYIAWERCCRNYTIDNIKSVDVILNPGTPDFAGQTFYLEFPAVVDEDGEPFINSSPQLFPPLNDYACPGRPYWVDFAGTDVDEDSLVYTLVTPLNTVRATAIVSDPTGTIQIGANPGPYQEVQWETSAGFSLNNIMGGRPDLEISSKGFLTVTPTLEGLFVFAVKCEEFRDGIKIGELIRDFQLLVLDGCPVADPPVVKGKKLTDGTYTDANFIEITFPNTTSDVDRCIDIQISDLDANKSTNPDFFKEDITFKAIALNFDASDEELGIILPDITQTILRNSDPEEFQICFPECPFIDPQKGDFLDIGVVAFDNACTLPLSDTLTVRVRVIPPDNAAPVLLTNGADIPALTRTEVQGAGKSISIPIEGADADGHHILMQINTVEEFDLAKAGMSFSTTPSEDFEAGPINTTFMWNLDCLDADLDFSEGVTVSPEGAEIVKKYQFEILLEDEDDCNYSREDKLEMDLNIKFPGEFAPNVYQVGQDATTDSLGFTFYLNDVINLNIRAKDGGTDTDNINLTAVGSNFDLDAYGVSFENKTNRTGEVTTPFQWSLDCDQFNLAELDSFRVYFITEDIDACNLANRDTLLIDFLIDTLQNNKPLISFQSHQLSDNQISTDIREEVSVNIDGFDVDQDSIFLDLLAVDGSRNIDNFEFESAKGKGSVRSTLTWTPDCEDLETLDPGSYRFTFVLQDGRCPNPASDTLSLDISVNDIAIIQEEFIPPNIFTPNGDENNPYFGMFKIVDGQEVSILPVDNCEGIFEQVNIYNRWGKEVYSSTARDFKWFGNDEPAGVYFYQLKYSHKVYKGAVSILY
jgi:hypothetical protein